jgi:hypothetical protein
LDTGAFTLPSTLTVIAAIKSGTVAGTPYPALFTSPSGGAGRPNLYLEFADAPASGKPAMSTVSGDTDLAAIRASVLSYDTPYTIYGRFNGAGSSGGVNGVDVPVSLSTVGAGTLTAGFKLGYPASIYGLVDVHVLEVFVVSGASMTAVTDVLSYFSTKWAIP